MSLTPRIGQLYLSGIKKRERNSNDDIKQLERRRWEKVLSATNKLIDIKPTNIEKSESARSTGSLLKPVSHIFSPVKASKHIKDPRKRNKRHNTIPTEDLTRAVNELLANKKSGQDAVCYNTMEIIPFPYQMDMPEVRLTRPVSTTINSLENLLL